MSVDKQKDLFAKYRSDLKKASDVAEKAEKRRAQERMRNILDEAALREAERVVESARQNEDSAIDQYARAVYEYFKQIKPDLIRRKTKEIVKWEDAFGNDYDSIPTGLKNSLVALIEEDGGKYRIV